METYKYKVIVAEDEELLLNNLVQKINNANLDFKVIAKAQTGTQAFNLANKLSPDLLITDIKMPLMDGITLIEKLHVRNPHIKSIIISGFSEFEYAQRAIKVQVVEYLLKPVDPDELYQALLKVKNRLASEENSYCRIFNQSMSRQDPGKIASILQEYIANHYTEDINMNLIARNMNYSSGYLTKIFFQQYGFTPMKYIISLRISKARNLLLSNPNLTIKQVGEVVGYPEQGYFSRIFKKHVGMSPFEYREIYGGNNENETEC